MGITTNTVELLVRAKKKGVNFGTTAMIGHQAFWHCDPDRFARIAASSGIAGHGPAPAATIDVSDGCYADPLFHGLGAARLDIYDVSGYENANIVHDFNYPIDGAHGGRYSALFDGGSLEHIYNVVAAVTNCMRMIAAGGHYLCVVPCDGWAGHGFYQFSAEFFYRTFSAENGFGATAVTLFNETGEPNLRELPDPKVVGRRIEFSSQSPVSLFVVSRKDAEVAPFKAFPQQSDYEFGRWKNG